MKINGKDMVFSYIYKENFIKSKICSDPVKTDKDVLIIYNSKNYSNDEVIDWIEKVKNLFGINFLYNIVDNTYKNYLEILEGFVSSYDKSIDIKNEYEKLSEYENEGYLLYFVLPKEINFSIKYLIFVILRYGICSSFKKLKKVILYLNKKRGLDFWKAIFFSHFDSNINENSKIQNKNNPVISERLGYFTFLSKFKFTVFFDLNDILNPNYLKTLKINEIFDERKIGSSIFSCYLNKHKISIDFKNLNDKELETFIESFDYETKFKDYVIEKFHSKELETLEKINDNLSKDKFDVFRNNALYSEFFKNDVFKFFITNNPKFYVENIDFYIDNFLDMKELEVKLYKTKKFISKYYPQINNLTDLSLHATVKNYINTLFSFENFNKIYKSIIQPVYENKYQNAISRSRS